MKTEHDIRSILAVISLPLGWRLRLTKKGDGYNVQIVFDALDSMSSSGEFAEHRCRKWYVSPHSTTTEIVRTIHKAGLAAIEHEFNEMFRYRGVAIANPHLDVDTLVNALAGKPLDKRDSVPV
jgi:hypothetical protein